MKPERRKLFKVEKRREDTKEAFSKQNRSERPETKIICETQARERSEEPRKQRSSSFKEHKVNALALGADEGRD